LELVWLKRASADLWAIEDYIGRDNPLAADDVAQRIVTSVAMLQEQPSAGRPGRVAQTRELAVPSTPYVVAYTAIRDRLYILAIMHGAQEWPKSF
jgi:addiction module RelE/StbE family toxin